MLNGYVLQVQLKKIKDDIVKARHLQDQIRVTDLKDRGIAEHNFERVVGTWSPYDKTSGF